MAVNSPIEIQVNVEWRRRRRRSWLQRVLSLTPWRSTSWHAAEFAEVVSELAGFRASLDKLTAARAQPVRGYLDTVASRWECVERDGTREWWLCGPVVARPLSQSNRATPATVRRATETEADLLQALAVAREALYLEARQHAACLTIAEGGPGTGDATDFDSLTMQTVRALRQRYELLRETARRVWLADMGSDVQRARISILGDVLTTECSSSEREQG